EQVEGWLRDAGLKPALQRDLAPGADAGPQALTVSLWLAEQPAEAAIQKNPARTRALEETP
ncbi:MAG TPA: ArsR family transcriptional regulator, partial [Hyphomicrobium sp.]|nr:ArsR family transcriptional regulator [Hyphomicrobium sp.]